MAAFVTGIAQTQDVDELERLLGAIPGVDHSKAVVITAADRTDEHDESFINFVHATTGGAEIIEGSGGTGVPGINGSDLGHLSHPHVVQHVGSLPIPEDEADNYNDAIDNGRSVIAYAIDGDTSSTEAAFKSAGLAHVKSFV